MSFVEFESEDINGKATPVFINPDQVIAVSSRPKSNLVTTPTLIAMANDVGGNTGNIVYVRDDASTVVKKLQSI